jgi:hypothetical protein
MLQKIEFRRLKNHRVHNRKTVRAMILNNDESLDKIGFSGKK